MAKPRYAKDWKEREPYTVWEPDTDTVLSIRDGIMRADWVNLGEGLQGDYDPDDPDDVNLLRFDIYYAGDPDPYDMYDEGWREVEDASYCTNMPADANKDVLEKSLRAIFDEYRDVIGNYLEYGQSVKKLGEGLSWISPDSFKEMRPDAAPGT